MARILVVDDEAAVRTAIRKFLSRSDHEVVEAADGETALTMYRKDPVDVVIMDIYMPVMDGIETTIRLKHEFPDVKIITVSGGGHMEKTKVLQREAGLGVVRTLAKPLHERDILDAVSQALGT